MESCIRSRSQQKPSCDISIFFNIGPGFLQLYINFYQNEATSWLRKITSNVAEINTKIYGFSFDLTFVAYPWERNSEQVLNFIKEEKISKGVEAIDNFIFNFSEKYGAIVNYERRGMLNSLSGKYFKYNRIYSPVIQYNRT